MPNFQFLRQNEADLITALADTLKNEFGKVVFLEIGVFGGNSTRGLADHCTANGIPLFAAGVDFAKYIPNPPATPDYAFYAGDSMDQWRRIERRDFNFLFIDGCHCVNHAICDFLNYSPFVQVGGYCLFHDTAAPTDKGTQQQEEWPQDHGYAGKPSSVLGVREGLRKLGLWQGYRADWVFVHEIPAPDGLKGMCLFKKIKEL